MPDPVAWTMIERGWVIRDAAGEEVGRVGQITGDENADIFDGLTISKGILSRDRYVPSEHVADIREGEIRLGLSRRDVEALHQLTETAPQEQILPESSSWYQRLADRLTGRRP